MIEKAAKLAPSWVLWAGGGLPAVTEVLRREGERHYLPPLHRAPIQVAAGQMP